MYSDDRIETILVSASARLVYICFVTLFWRYYDVMYNYNMYILHIHI